MNPSGRYGTSPMQPPAEVFLRLRSFLSGVEYYIGSTTVVPDVAFVIYVL